jgi:DNA-binding transcriptional ArsR family regulator
MNYATYEVAMKPAFSEEIQVLAERQAALCKVFSNIQRILILWLLTEKERTVGEIAEAIGASLPSTSQHLHLMELSNILESRREHQNIYYRIADNELLKNCLVLANRPREQLMENESQT